MGDVDLGPSVDDPAMPDQEQTPEFEQMARMRMAMGTQQIVAQGGDPLMQTPNVGGAKFPMHLEIERRWMLEKQRNKQMNDAVFMNPESGFGQIASFMEDVMKRYRAQNDSELIKKPKNQEEALLQMEQLKPVQVDPNEVANIRSLAVKLDQQMKQIDPRFSFWTHPRTKKFGDWLNREAGGGGVGYLQSGEQKLKTGVVGSAAQAGLEFLEGAADIGINATLGLHDMARQGIQALGGPDIGSLAPTNYVMGDDGKLYSNGAKAPSFLDGMSTIWAFATNRNIEQAVAEVGRAKELEIASRNGFESITHGASRIAGIGLGFGTVGGAAMSGGAKLFGGLTQKGLTMLGGLRLGRGLQQSERALSIIRTMSKGVGAAVGNGALEGAAYGRTDGYAKSFMHGMSMAPVLMALGAMGRRAEWFAKNRANMPAPVAKMVGSAMEGAGFGAMEAHFPQLLPAAWGFIKNPNEETWQTYAKNIAGFMMFSAMSRGRSVSPGAKGVDAVTMQVTRGNARASFAEKVARGEATPEEISRAPTPDEAKLRSLGEANIKQREGKTPEERKKAAEEKSKIEEELDINELGVKGTAQKTVESAVEQISKKESFHERVAALRDMPNTPEKRKEIISLLKESHNVFLDSFKNFVVDVSKIKLENDLKNQKQQREVMEASNVVKALLSDKKTATDFKSELTKKLAEEGVTLPDDPTLEKQRKKEEQAGGDDDAEIEKMAAKMGMDPNELRAEMGLPPKAASAPVDPLKVEGSPERMAMLKDQYAHLRQKTRYVEGKGQVPVEQIEGKEPGVKQRVESDQRPWIERMAQEGGKEGLEPDKLVSENKEKLAADRERRLAGTPDPLEDPRFRELEASVQEKILAEQNPLERKRLFRDLVVERRQRATEPTEAGESEPTEAAIRSEGGAEAEAGGASEAPEVGVRAADRAGPGGERRGPQSLQVPPTRQIEPTAGVQPLRAKDIILEMQGRPGRGGFRIPLTAKRVGGTKGDPVQVPMRGGKIEGPALGHFKFFENLVRTQDGRDLVVASHEWSHAMHRHMSGGGGRNFSKEALRQYKNLDDATRQEIHEILKDYPRYQKLPKNVQWMEAWAEWNARNLLGETDLDKKLPNLTKYFRSWLAKPAQAELRVQYNRIQEMLYRYNAQGSRQRVRMSTIADTEPLSPSERAQKPSIWRIAVDETTKALFDDMVELKRSQDRWLEASGRKPEDVSIMEDPARLFDALRMTADKTVSHFVNEGIRSPDGEFIPGMKEVLRPVMEAGKINEFVDFAVSVRNLEIYNKGKPTQLPPADYAETFKQISASSPEVVEAARGLKRWTDALVDYVARSGNLDPEQAQKIKDAHALYVPFFRSMEGPQRHAPGRGVAERGTGLQRLKGSTYEIRDPLVALQEVAGSMVAKAHQNQVVTALYKMAIGQEAGGLATIVPKTKVPHDHPVRMLLDAIEKKMPEIPGIETLFDALRDIDALDPQVVTTFAQKIIPTGTKSVMAYTPRLTDHEIARLVELGGHEKSIRDANNKVQWLEVDTKVYEALMGVDKMPHLPEHLQGIMKMLQVPRDLVRFFATGVSPAFTASNMIRDALTEPIFTSDGKVRPFGGFVKLIRGAIEYHKNGNLRELYEELGVKTSSFYNEGMRREIAGQNKGFRQTFLHVTNRIQEFFAHPENYLRMARFKDAYNEAKAAGKPEQEARMLALEAGKELMNFARAGVVGRMLNQMIPYFNAGLQGKRKFYGQILWGGDAKGDVMKARVQRAAILNGLAQITLPSMALWLMNKDEDWYQDLPDWRKVNYWNVKIGEEIMSIPKPFEAGVIFGSLPEIMLDKQLENANPASLSAAAEVALGSYMEGIGAFIPAFLRPIVEATTNYDFFRRRKLTPEWIQRSMPPAEQATFYTTATARILSQAVNGALTPIEVEALLGGYTAGATTSAMRAVDELVGLKDHPLGLPLPWTRFFTPGAHSQSAYVDDLYKLSVDLDQRESTLKPRELNLKRRVDVAKKNISNLRNQAKAGSIPVEDAERRAFELAKPIIKESQR